jgi:hypothetical protein
MLYPKCDLTKPAHSPAVTYKKQHKLRSSCDEKLSEKSDSKSFASTAVSSTLSKQGVVIPPKKYSKLTDRQLELLLKKQFRDNAQYAPEASIVSYKVVDKDV